MYFKLTLLAVLFCLVQANASIVAHSRANFELGKLKDLVEKAVDEATNKINGLLESVKGKAQEIIDKTTQEINDKISRLVENVNALKDSAQEVGVDISDCLNENEADLKELADKSIQDLLSCVTNRINQAEDIVTKLFESFKKALDLVLDFGNEVKLCQGVTCIVKLSAKITIAISKVPFEIAKGLAEAFKLIEGLQDSIPVCAAGKAIEAGVEGEKMVEKIGNCVRDNLGS